MSSKRTSTTTSTRHLVLVGLMASGKTTVGRLLGVRLGRPFVDNDVVLERRTGHSAREIALADGADALHLREAEALIDALAQPVPAVVAAAAAAPLEPLAVAVMRLHDVVYLRATPEVLAARLAKGSDDDHRPFVSGDAGAVPAAQFAARDARYRALAKLVVDADIDDADAIVDAIMSALAR
jgi:shikimate kinase